MRVAVTGAHGFTGRYMMEELDRCGHEARALVADITDARALDEAVAAAQPEAVIHLAGSAFVDTTDHSRFYAVNQIGTINLLDALGRHAPGIRVIIASTAQVYGPQAEGLLGEDCPLAPANHYAVSKTAMEIASHLWDDRLAMTLVRPFNYTGVGQQQRYLIPKIVAHFRSRAATVELGNMDVRRDFGDVRDVVSAYAMLLEAPAAPRICNVATAQAHSVRDIVDRLTIITGHHIDVHVNPAFVRSNDVPVLAGDNRRLRDAIDGWSARPIDATLEWMLHARQ